jgi:ElaB/YqjD/DUF883 family membrane-anchored ribosome-binding protein
MEVANMADVTAKDRAKDYVAETIDKTKSAVSDGLDAAREKFEDAAENIDDRYQRVRKTAERASDAAREKYRVAAETVREGYGKVKTDIKRVSSDVNEYVRENPGKSLLMAAGVGFLLGLLVRRRRDDD